MITPSIFFDNTLYIPGDHKCFGCGAPCSDKYTTKEYISKVFGNRDTVYRPSSPYLCGGCVSSWQEKIDIKMPDGEIRTNQRVRQYSWIVTKDYKQAYTKAHINILRNILLNPPEPPFSIVLAESGQKHLIFRSKINLNNYEYMVSLEEDYILVNKNKLKEYLDFLIQPISIVGKIAILEQLSISQLCNLEESYGSRFEDFMETLSYYKNTHLFKLAVWLSPNKESCLELKNGSL